MMIKNQNKYKNVIFFERGKHKENIPNSCFFFDRDGIIIEDCHYISSPEDVKLCPGAKELLRYLHNQKKLIIVVTNQSGISKKLLTWRDYKKVTSKLIKLLGDPNPISAIYANSYSQLNNGSWRKPNTGMIKQAASDFSIDLHSSFLVGDRKSDIDAGLNAGIKNLVHVKTGHGFNERDSIKSKTDSFGNYKSGDKYSKISFITNLVEFKKLLD